MAGGGPGRLGGCAEAGCATRRHRPTRPSARLQTGRPALHPDAHCTWLLTEIDEGTDLAFGLCELGLGCPELGYVSLTELRTIRGKLGLPIERNLHFEADKPISAYADEARSRGHIVT